MATPISGDIWHLSIDDLLAPIPESPRLGGPGPFVINLSASTAPISPPRKEAIGCDGTYVYQVQRTEDRRVRYRLRLGPFVTEDDAESMLAKVRDVYPSALTATAEPDDLRMISSLRTKNVAVSAVAPSTHALAVQPAAAPSAPAPAVQPAAAPVVTPAPAPTGIAVPAATVSAAIATPAIAATSAARSSDISQIPVLTEIASLEPRAAATPKVTPASAPFVSAAAPLITAPASTKTPPTLKTVIAPPAAATPMASPAAMAPPALPSKPSAPVSSMPAPQAIARASQPAPRAGRIEKLSTPLPNLESTQTLRPLTALELEDTSGSQWFVIQLSASEVHFDPDSLPNLDIFSMYRLYAVTGIDQGKVLHALRLGFFSEEIAAKAVASYLAGVYESPVIKRVSNAERERFANQRVEARKDIGATGKHAAIEITGDRIARKPKSASSIDPQTAHPEPRSGKAR